MIHRYWKFGICLMGLLSFLNVYAQPLCCSRSFCSNGSLPAIESHATVLKNLTAFSAIDANGPMDVQIFGGASCEQVVVVDPRAIRAEVRGGTLFLSEGTRPLARSRLLVKVYMDRDLTQLSLSDSASIAGECIQSCRLAIFNASCGSLCLKGHIVLNKLVSTGSGNIDLEWVDSNSIEIIANDSGHIHLAGRANQLYAKLSDAAQLDTQYLRVTSAWVKAEDVSQVEVMSSESLHAFANDAATVGYYRAPRSSYINTQNSANAFWWAE